ncbi:MAG: flagellar filament capping protein FliD [Gammaproteobacteria bacterium]|nr:flagellar filament capping protein FliD [Gammaproteobacteria bacterium]
MPVTASGLGTGLDITGIVDQLVFAERAPTGNRLNLQETRANAELSAIGSLKSSLTSFQGSLEVLSILDNFQKRMVTVGDEEIFTAEVTSKAVPGFFDVDVQNLASVAKLRSQAFTDALTPLGYGTLSISVDGNTSLITIDPAANTLTDIRAAINDDPTNPGVRATVVNAADGAYLVVTSKDTGANQQITISQSGGDGGLAAITFDPNAGSNPMVEDQIAADAAVFIDGIRVTSNSNTIADAIEGVTLNLETADPGNVVPVNIEFDELAAKTAVNEFVSAYNTVMTTLGDVTKFDAESGVAAPLLGDPLVRGLKSSLRRDLNSPIDGLNDTFRTLADLGLQTEANGTLTLDADKLAAALASNFDDVGQLFAKENGGIAVKLNKLIDNVLGGTGTFDAREKTLNDRLERIQDQRDQLEVRMDSVRARLTEQFNAMDRLVANLNQTSTFLTQQLGSPGLL